MRNVFGAMGILCGAIVVALVGRYGYKSTDIEADAWIVGFLYAAIATFGLGGHAFAVYLWRHSWIAAIVAGIIAFGALSLNLSNSLGAIAGRQDNQQSKVIENNRQIRSAEAEVKRLQGLRDAMPTFATTDAASVEAAKRAADAATKSREAECVKRGSNCQARETDERASAKALSEATANKAATDRAARIESNIDTQRTILSRLGSIQTVNAQGSTIAKLFRLPDDEAGFAATVQQSLTSVMVELIVIICLIGWEVSRPKTGTHRHEMVEAAPVAVEPEPVAQIEPPKPIDIPKPAKPRLIASSAKPVGSVSRILADILKAAPGDKVDIAEVGRWYREACAAQGKDSVSKGDFIKAASKFCDVGTIKRRDIAGRVYLMDVQLDYEKKMNMPIDKPA